MVELAHKDPVPETPMATKTVPWAYSGPQGPEHWGDLSRDFISCKIGQKQSPINIEHVKLTQSFPKLVFHYTSSPLQLQHDGRLLLAKTAPQNSMLVGKKRFELKTLIFHSPSEHTVEEAPYTFEVQLIHQNEFKEFAVVSIFLQESKKSHAAISTLWKALPSLKGELGPQISFQLSSLLPRNRDYYTYSGSLTTPPCTEGFTWYILKSPSELSTKQVDAYHALFKKNARPAQRAFGRVVYLQSQS